MYNDCHRWWKESNKSNHRNAAFVLSATAVIVDAIWHTSSVSRCPAIWPQLELRHCSGVATTSDESQHFCTRRNMNHELSWRRFRLHIWYLLGLRAGWIHEPLVLATCNSHKDSCLAHGGPMSAFGLCMMCEGAKSFCCVDVVSISGSFGPFRFYLLPDHCGKATLFSTRPFYTHVVARRRMGSKSFPHRSQNYKNNWQSIMEKDVSKM